MFDFPAIITAFANLLGWKDHYDLSEIPALPASLTTTETGEYYQQKHPALRLDIVQALIPDNYPLDTYLRDQITDASVEMLNDLAQYRGIKEFGKTILEETQLLNKYGFLNDKIANQSRFVGLQIRPKTAEGFELLLNQIGLQFAEIENFDLYLFHSSLTAPVAQITVATTGGAQWNWTNLTDVQRLPAFTNTDKQGGVYVLGYYQDDLTGNAINCTNFNWDRGACGSCNKSNYKGWQSINEFFTIYPLYVPQGSYVVGEMFDLNDAIYSNDQSFGLNLRLSAKCNLTDFVVRNKLNFQNLLSLKVTEKILNQMKFSQQINFIEENIKMMIIRDLEGDLETRMNNITRKYAIELKAVSWNTAGLNEKCLPCTDVSYTPAYGVI